MTRRKLLLAALLGFGLLGGASRAEDKPVRVELLRIRAGKPPLKYHQVHLTLVNPQDKPVWLVLPDAPDKPLAANGVFPCKNGTEQPFGGKQYSGEGGVAVEVLLHGGNGFRAFRLPAKGRVELEDYEIDAYKDVREMVVLEVRELKVNGKTALEKWLPYATTSGAKVAVGPRGVNDWKNLDWDPKTLKSRVDYPNETVTELRGEGVRSWTIRFEPKAEK